MDPCKVSSLWQISLCFCHAVNSILSATAHDGTLILIRTPSDSYPTMHVGSISLREMLSLPASAAHNFHFGLCSPQNMGPPHLEQLPGKYSLEFIYPYRFHTPTGGERIVRLDLVVVSYSPLRALHHWTASRVGAPELGCHSKICLTN